MSAVHRSGRLLGQSEPRQRLLRLMQTINFGRINFLIRSGEPDLSGPWRTRQTVKLSGGENGPRSETCLTDCELCREQTALLEALDRLGDGVCVTVEVRHGVPFLFESEQDHQTT